MVLRITRQQERQVRYLVRRRCVNYRKGNCLLLDGLEERSCVQLLCRSGIFCRYFQKAVLPKTTKLYKQILTRNQKLKEE